MAYINTLTGQYWSDETLKAAIKGVPVEPLKIADLNLNMRRFPSDRLIDMVHHCGRVMNALTRIPIIVGPDNEIYDGCHRVVKAIIEGKDEILCHRLATLPKHDKIMPGKWERVG